MYRNGSLWTAHSIRINFGSGNVSAIRWVQIDVSWPTTVSLIQESTFGADGMYFFYPTVMVDGSNTLAISFARSSLAEFGSAAYTGRLGTDPANTLQPSTLLKAGIADYQRPDSSGASRWGDYYGIGLDPSDGSFWILGEYAASSNQWGTWVGQLEFPPGAASLVSAVLPSSRSVQVGSPASAFATVINLGPGTATGCSLAPKTVIPATFTYQTTNPMTNTPIGTPDTPVDIAPSTNQSFVFAFTPMNPFAPTDVQLSFACTNAAPAPITIGLNTLLLSASATPVPDLVALAATPSNDGILTLASGGAFAVASVNVGAGGLLTVSADTGAVSLPVNLVLCQTNPVTAACLAPATPTVTVQIDANATPTFSIFVGASGPIAFDPATNRIFVRFTDSGSIVRGATSVAVRTP